MSNGEAERPLEIDAPNEAEAATPTSQARPVKPKAAKERTAKRAAAKTVAKSPVRTTTPAKRSKRPASGTVRVKLGSNAMVVSQTMADALTRKDLKRLREIFKRALKRAREGDEKKKKR